MSVQPNAQTALEPATYVEYFVEIDDLRLHVQDYGTSGKPPMLCVHGGAANAHWYDFVAQGFNADYHVRAVDLRGHGDSDWDNSNPPNYNYSRHAADIHELTEKLDLHDFILIGHSMGGMVSSVYTATYPGRAKALIVVDSNLDMTPERIAGFNAVGNRQGREYATQDEFIANFRVRPGGCTAPPEALHHIAQHAHAVEGDRGSQVACPAREDDRSSRCRPSHHLGQPSGLYSRGKGFPSRNLPRKKVWIARDCDPSRTGDSWSRR
jgi:pimeloyl-ACP methyl ester carboxylesterase